MLTFLDGFGRIGHPDLSTDGYTADWGGVMPNCYGAGDNADRLRMDAVDDESVRTAAGMSGPNWAAEVSVTIAALIADVGSIYLMIRHQGADHKHYGVALSVNADAANDHPEDASWHPATDTAYLYRCDGAAVVVLDSVALDLAAETAYRLRLSMRGDQLSVAIDGREILSAADTTARTSGWTPGVAAMGVVRLGGVSAASNAVIDWDDLMLWSPGHGQLVLAQAAYDEEAGIVRFSVPAAGSEQMGQVYCYHVSSGEWTVEDLATSCLTSVTDDRGVARTIYGDPVGGKLWQMDDTTTRTGAAFTASWRSGWLELPDHAVVSGLAARLELSATLQAALEVETAEDPSDPRTYSAQQLVAGLAAPAAGDGGKAIADDSGRVIGDDDDGQGGRHEK